MTKKPGKSFDGVWWPVIRTRRGRRMLSFLVAVIAVLTALTEPQGAGILARGVLTAGFAALLLFALPGELEDRLRRRKQR